MNLFGAIICLFKGHDIDPEESIVSDLMHDKRNWLCKCHRCGLYEMHDGAILQKSITITERSAKRTRLEFAQEMAELRRRIEERKNERVCRARQDT